MKNRLRHPSHRITATGYYVAGFTRQSDHYSGRVVEDPHGEWLDIAVYADWDRQGNPINHDFGNLVKRTNNDD